MIFPRRSIGGALLGVLLGTVPAASQDAQPAAQPSPVGYQGVVPGSGQPPAVVDKPGSDTSITWPGFQMLPNGGSRFFVQATGSLSTSVDVGQNQIVVDLGPAKLATDTNGLMLETKFFNTPVKRAFVRKKGGSAQLVLVLRAPAQPLVRTQQAGTGFFFVYVDFGPGQFIEAKAAPVVEAAAAEPVAQSSNAVVMPKQPARPDHLDNSMADPPKRKGKFSAKGSASAGAGGGKAKAKAKGGISLGM